MPAHIRKGLITGAPAFNSGGLGLSIGSRVGGIRHMIARRAPDEVKIASGNSGPLSFYVEDAISGQSIVYKYGYAAENSVNNTIGFAFASYNTSTQHPTYSILQNKYNVFLTSLYIKDFDLCGNSVGLLPLSKFVANVTTSTFEITIPSIKQSVINDLSSNDYASDLIVFEQSGNELILGEINDDESLLDGTRFVVLFVINSNASVQQARTTLTNYTGKTYKFELYTNESGAVTVNNTKYDVKRFAAS